jgi:hypothetical protein
MLKDKEKQQSSKRGQSWERWKDGVLIAITSSYKSA